ncbi:MAG: P-II family nitrogen regulator, partial [Nitrososphaeraceae archaeon]
PWLAQKILYKNWVYSKRKLKRIDLIIPLERLRDLNDLLHEHNVGGLTFYDVKGRGRTRQEPVAVGRGVMRYIPEFGSRMKVEVLVSKEKMKPLIDDILAKIGTGSLSDGKIFVYDVSEAYDIGSKESGDNAL